MFRHLRTVIGWLIIAACALALLGLLLREASADEGKPQALSAFTQHALSASRDGWQPAWKRGMLSAAVRIGKPVLDCRVTVYWEGEKGVNDTTAWSSPLRWGVVAADPRYWGPGSVVWIGPPFSSTFIVEDKGGAIKGPHRFDVGMAYPARKLNTIHACYYVPLYRTPPITGPWGRKPQGWLPPVWEVKP